MSSEEGCGLGYRAVDDASNLPFLLSTMDATSRWDATRVLRRWERRHLSLAPGERLLDVGCGMGDAALGLAEDLGPSGEVVGIDASAAMVAVAQERADSAPGRVRFSVGDALSIHEPDESFDAVRSERTLQWVTDPSAAVAEMARVLRPGGRLALIDTDWSTLRLDVGDPALGAMVREALRDEGKRPSQVGSRLPQLVEAGGVHLVAATEATQRWSRWDPDRSPVPEGLFSMRSLADDLVEAGQLGTGDVARFVDTVHEAARQDHFAMSLTMFAVVGERRSTT